MYLNSEIKVKILRGKKFEFCLEPQNANAYLHAVSTPLALDILHTCWTFPSIDPRNSTDLQMSIGEMFYIQVCKWELITE